MKTECEALLRNCPLCDRPHSQFTHFVEFPFDLGWQILHKCPDGHAKTLAGKTRQAAIDEWNFYCELTGKAAAVILTFLITKSTKGASSRAAPFFMAGLTVRKSQCSGALQPLPEAPLHKRRRFVGAPFCFFDSHRVCDILS
jgi:hypothetical protein